MTSRPSGLRFQIILSLALLITLLSGLLGFALISISSTAMIKERRASVRLTQISAARSVVSALAAGVGPGVLREMSDSWLASGGLDGIWIMDGSGNVRRTFVNEVFKDVRPEPNFPPTEVYESVRIRAVGEKEPGGGHVFTQFPGGRGLGMVVVGTHAGSLGGSPLRLGTFLVLYLLIHAVAILAFGYFSLTHLIVRPVERLRRQAVKLGEGKFNVEGERKGAKEIREVGEALRAAAARLKSQRDELVEKIAQLEKARGETLKSQEAVLRSQKLASVGRLTAGVAHEIGNPLTAIIGLIEVLEDEGLTLDKRRDFLGRMKKEAERVNGIIRDLLTYARADGREISKIRLEDAVEDACDIMKPQKLFKNVELRCDVEEGLPSVEANRDRMVQVMVNLLMNAAEAMVGEGAVTISLCTSPEPGMVELAVEDAGPGIPEEVAGEIFEPFVTTKPEGRGTGLGLSVCHGIVRSFGGAIAVENRREGGARFVIKLPAAAR